MKSLTTAPGVADATVGGVISGDAVGIDGMRVARVGAGVVDFDHALRGVADVLPAPGAADRKEIADAKVGVMHAGDGAEIVLETVAGIASMSRGPSRRRNWLASRSPSSRITGRWRQ